MMTARAFFMGVSGSFQGLEQIQQPSHVAGEEAYQQEAFATGYEIFRKGEEPEETSTHQHRRQVDDCDAHNTQGMNDRSQA